ncbi:MAG: hypothetical protein K8T90_09985 [Planctomycetes bacterium]|nr:hypothetical protein [Planctomycetota bacterium]
MRQWPATHSLEGGGAIIDFQSQLGHAEEATVLALDYGTKDDNAAATGTK